MRGGATRFVHTSSIVVFGDEFTGEVDERTPVHGTGRPYTDTKIAGEQLVLQAHAAGELPCTVIRPGDVYGPASRPWVILPLEAIRRRQLVLPARGRGLISPVYVDDRVDMYPNSVSDDYSSLLRGRRESLEILQRLQVDVVLWDRSLPLTTILEATSRWQQVFLDQNGWVVCSATSSIEQMLIVESVNGTPALAAARAARISPSACCMPVSPVGASATGILTGCPTIALASVRFDRSTATRWRSLILAKSSSLAR